MEIYIICKFCECKISIGINICFRSKVLRDSMHGLSKILGAREDRSRGAGGRDRRWNLQFVLPGRGRSGSNGDIDGYVAVEEAPFETHTVRLTTRDGWQISVRGPKVYCLNKLFKGHYLGQFPKRYRTFHVHISKWKKKDLSRSFRATPVLGFLPQELLGTSMYEYYHHDDIPHLAESHKAALQTSERVTTQVINIDYLQSLFCNDTRPC